MELSKKRWIILVASCFINLCIGSMYSWSVYAAPMAHYLENLTGTAISTLAIVFTVANSIGPITMISGGTINDRLGPRWVIFIGGLLFGGGMILSGFATSVKWLIISYGLGCGLGMGMVYGCTVSNSVKFFPDKKGLAGGLTTASYGISSVIMPPIANSLITRIGVTDTLKTIGGIILLIICTGAFFISKCPAGFQPEGWTPSLKKSDFKAVEDKNWRRMLADPIFYIMLLMLTSGAFSGLMIISQASPLAQNMVGMSATSAAMAVAVLALFNAAGRVLAGLISDKIGAINTLAFFFIIYLGGLTMLYFCQIGDVALFYTAVSIIGLCFGSIMGIYPGFTAAQFGTGNNSVNYGIMFIGFALAGYFGPTIMSNVYSSDGAYQRAFIIAFVLVAAGFALSFIFRGMDHSRKKQTNNYA